VMAASEFRSVTRAERSVATGEAAPAAATAVGALPTQGMAGSPPPPPSGATQTGPGVAPPPPPGAQQAWTPPPAEGGGGRKWLPFALGGAALAVIAVLVVLLLAGGGDDSSNTVAKTTPTTPTATTPATDPQAESDIRIGVETTLGAAKNKKVDVFCGGLSLRYENASFGGPGECQKRVRSGDIPEQLKTASTVTTIQVEGTKATATLDNGAKLFLVKGESFWEIDGVG
jgi:hypothetical protein